ncbi:MAG TPA: TraR/DksA family transcriptional regulator [Albitalea sp.]
MRGSGGFIAVITRAGLCCVKLAGDGAFENAVMDLTLSQLDELGVLLKRRQAQLRAEIEAHRREREAAGERAGETADQKDEASVRQLSAMVEAEDERDLAELQSIEAALRRMSEGRYGDCLDCGEPIGLQRLLAQPDALRCARCQSAWERKHR